LYEYSRPKLEGDDDPDLGPDGDLVSSMMSTAIIPRLCKIVEGGACDPYSTKSVCEILSIVEQVEASIETGNVKFQVRIIDYHCHS
jgi:GC-rich sequence DNA-binding factor